MMPGHCEHARQSEARIQDGCCALHLLNRDYLFKEGIALHILQEGTYLRRSCTRTSARGCFRCSFASQQLKDKLNFVYKGEDSPITWRNRRAHGKRQRERQRERERGSFCTFVKAVPLLTLEEFDGPKLSIPHNGLPQRCLDAWSWRLVQAFQSFLLESETCRLWWEGGGPISTLVLWHFNKRERIVTASGPYIATTCHYCITQFQKLQISSL